MGTSQREHLRGQGEAGSHAKPRSPRVIALVGPYLSGKTTLLDALLARTGGIQRQGSVKDKTSVGDGSPEARNHGMSTELNVANLTFLGDAFTILDCPGSLELHHETAAALSIADAAVVVAEPDPRRVRELQLVMKQLEDRSIPHLLFLNKIDACTKPLRDILPSLQPASERPLVLRQIPIWENGVATGYVDLALERAFVYRKDAPSEVVALPEGVRDREKDARFHMLEQLADYDDALMEQLLSDIPPDETRIFEDLKWELGEGLICPVLFGSAEQSHGIVRLLKALRHDVPFAETTAKRLGLPAGARGAYVVKTLFTGHGGKLAIGRVFGGEIAEGATLEMPSGAEERVSGLVSLLGGETSKKPVAGAGDVVGIARLDKARTGDWLSCEGEARPELAPLAQPEPVLAVGLKLRDRKDEVKLSSALQKLAEEDPSLIVEHVVEPHQILLKGQGEMHVRIALERLQRKFGVAVERVKREIAYRETIRGGTEVRGRHKKQSGGHGQFGDVVLRIEPQARGAGFLFEDKITGGVVPRQFIPSVEIGVADYLKAGPLGFPVVDLKVTLLDGSYHTVDSSDMAFRQAGRLAMSDGMPKCLPVLLEPILAVEIRVPSEATARVNGIISQRRGQILGFDARPGWPQWDVVEARIPDAEMDDLIIELRSATGGAGSFVARFDHLAELTGRHADHVQARHRAAAA